MKQLTLIVLFWLMLLATVEAATRYAATTGGGSACTVITTPCTVSTALGQLQSGDTLYLRGGTYNVTINNVVAGTPGAPTLVSNFSGETVILKPSSCPNEIVGSGLQQYVTFHGLIVDGSLLPNSTVNCQGVTISTNMAFENGEVRFMPRTGVFVLRAGGTIRNSWIHHNGSDIDPNGAPDHGIYVSGGNPSQNTLIEGNTINNNSSLGVHAHASGCVGCIDNLIVRGNTIFHNGVGDARAGDQVIKRFGGGVLIDDGTNQRVYNNVIYDEGSSSSFNAGVWLWDSNTFNAVVSNNTIYNSSYGIRQNDGGSGSTFQNNILWQITGGSITVANGATPSQDHNLCTSGCTGTGAINGSDPLFANASTHDFHILSGSPARNTGAAIAASLGCSAGSTCTDFSGVTIRPQGAGWDMGAYEFASASVPVLAIKAISPAAPSTCDPAFSSCTVVGSANNIITLAGTSTQSGGSVVWACDRCGSGGTTGTVANWITTNISLKSGVNIITITGTDSGGSAGSTQISVTFVPTFPGNAAVLLLGLENGSGTTATDSSGNSNTGTLVNGPTWVTTGRFGKALSFNGINQYITISDSNSLHLTQGFTISAWVQPAASFTTFKAIVHENSDPLNSPYQLYASVNGYCGSGGISGFTNVNGASGPQYSACTPTPLQTNVWTHLALTYDQTNLKLYRNGVLIVTTPASGYMEPSTLTLQIGGSEFGEYFQGLIDEVRVYNFAIPITAGSNTVTGASCTATNWTDNNAVATASIVGNMNCPIINLNPPSQFKVSAGATQLKFGPSATAAKIGANP